MVINKNTTFYGLKDTLQTNGFEYVDTDNVSRNYFRVSLPSSLGLGKNVFSINPTKNFVKNSRLLIDIEDYAGNPVYYEISNIVDSGNRQITVFITPETALGKATIYISGVINKLSDPIRIIEPSTVLWKTIVDVTNVEVNIKPIYDVLPTIVVTETRKPIYIQNASRRTDKSIGTFANLKSTNIVPYESRVTDVVFDSKTSFAAQNTIITNNVGTNSPEQKYEHFDYDVIYMDEPFFYDDNGLIDNGTFEFYNVVDTQSYTCSIVHTIDQYRAKVYPPFSLFDSSLNLVTSFVSNPNYYFTYFSKVGWAIDSGSKSYLDIEISNLRPKTGNVTTLKVEYTSNNSFNGSYVDMGKFEIENSNILIDESVLISTGKHLGYKEFGEIITYDDATNYFTYSQVGQSIMELSPTSSNGIYVTETKPNLLPDIDYGVISIANSYRPVLRKNVDYTLQFDYKFIQNPIIASLPQLDVYISGSVLPLDIIAKPHVNLLTNYGNCIGIVANKNIGVAEFSFNSTLTATASVNFAVRSGDWYINNIKLFPKVEQYSTPNFASFLIPMPQIEKNAEYTFRFSYLGNSGLVANGVTEIKGLIFTGSDHNFIERDEINVKDHRFIIGATGSQFFTHVDQMYHTTGSSGHSTIISQNTEIQHKKINEVSRLTSRTIHKIYSDYTTVPAFTSTPAIKYISLPLLYQENGSTAYTASTSLVGVNIEVRQQTIGTIADPFTSGSGSAVAGSNSYVWGGIMQTRAIGSAKVNNGQLQFFTPYTSSGPIHGQNAVNNFGYVPPNMTDLDHWFNIHTPTTGSNSYTMNYNYSFINTSSADWSFYSTMDVQIQMSEYAAI